MSGLALVAGRRWFDHAAAAAAAEHLAALGWVRSRLVHATPTPAAKAFLTAWAAAGGRARHVPDIASVFGRLDGPNLLVVFIAEDGDDAGRAEQDALRAGWPPVVVHTTRRPQPASTDT